MDDLCNILYTSGTTGDSKGVMLTYGQYDAALAANDAVVKVGENDRIIQFLPVTHIFERGFSYLGFSEGSHIIINTDPHEIQQSMRETHAPFLGEGISGSEGEDRTLELVSAEDVPPCA